MLNSIGCRKITCATCPTCPMGFVLVDFNNTDYEFIKDLDPLSLVLVLKTKFEEFHCGEIELEWARRKQNIGQSHFTCVPLLTQMFVEISNLPSL